MVTAKGFNGFCGRIWWVNVQEDNKLYQNEANDTEYQAEHRHQLNQPYLPYFRNLSFCFKSNYFNTFPRFDN